MRFYPAISYGITEAGVNVGRINSLHNGERASVVWDPNDPDYLYDLRAVSKKGFSPKAIHAITDDGRIAGCFKFYTKRDRLYAKGTYVWPNWRKEGAGKFLWKTAIEMFNPRLIKVTVVSDLGKTLVNSLRKTYPDIKFKVNDHGYRPLRIL